MSQQFEIIRAANTTAYAAGQVINNDSSTNMLSFEYPQNYLQVLSGKLISSNPSGTPIIHMHLFKNSFSIAADGSAFAPSDAQAKDGYIGTLVFDTWYNWSSNKVSVGKPIAPFNVDQNTVYSVLTAGGAYTPISAEVINGELSLVR